MRKSSFIAPKILAGQTDVVRTSTDFIRLITTYLLLNEPAATGRLSGPMVIEGKVQFRKDDLETTNDLGKALKDLNGEDDLAWIGAVGIIKRCYPYNIVIEGVPIKPQRVRALQDSEPEIKIKAAFIGHSKNMNCSDSRMDLYGHKKIYYIEVQNSKDLEAEFNKAKPRDSRYVDFINCILPADRRNVDDIEIWKEDFEKNAKEVANFLLKD